MGDRRNKKRYRTRAYCGVYDADKGSLLGCLVDISTEGLKIMAADKLTPGPVYRLKIEMHKEIKGSKNIYLNARCVWSDNSVDPSFFISGFEFIEITESTQERIRLYTESTIFESDKVKKYLLGN